MKTKIYLDYAAATPLDKQVLAVMKPYFIKYFYNPSADYDAARQIRQQINQARSKVAYWLGCKPAEIVFTAGGTEANNLAIHGVMRRYPSGNLVISAVEHESVTAPAHNYQYKELPVTQDGRIDLNKVETAIDDQTVLVSVMYANNEIGTVQPIKQLAAKLAAIRQSRQASGNQLPLILHTDACQAGNYLDLHVARLGVDLMTINGGKVYGPKQSGALFVSRSVSLKPLVDGGGQERNLRSGTENVVNDIGLSTALDLAQQRREVETVRTALLSKQFIDLALRELKQVRINGSSKYRLPNNVHLTFPGHDNERLIIGLDQSGIMAAAGSACSAAKEEPSHVLAAIGLSGADARSSLRFSLGRETSVDDIVLTVKALKKLLG